ncbi:sigma-70 family RNA polymerase sigma factor [Actinopolymorpha pittospori]
MTTMAMVGNPAGPRGHERDVDVLTELDSDQELWRRASAGEEAAFGQLFDRHARTVYNFLFRRTASWSEAEDLTSAVFLHAWRRRRQVVLDRESALPWLLKVADYTARNERRALRRYRAAIDRLNLAPEVQPDHADTVAERVDDERAMGEVRRALNRLPRHERQVIELSVWTGLDHQAVAVALGVPVGTVKSRLSRARKRLHGLLLPTYLISREPS